MRKFFLFAPIVLLFISCSAKNVSKQGHMAKIDSGIERIIIDYKGAGIGEARPDWVSAAVNDDYAAFDNMERFKDKIAVIGVERGQNLDLLKSWANNFNIQAQISRQISNMISAEFGGGQQGDKNSSEEADTFIREIVASLSKARIVGLRKEMDYWIKMRMIDKVKKEMKEYYEYFVVYSIGKESLEHQINVSLGKIEAKTQKQKEIKTQVESRVLSLSTENLNSTVEPASFN